MGSSSFNLGNDFLIHLLIIKIFSLKFTIKTPFYTLNIYNPTNLNICLNSYLLGPI